TAAAEGRLNATRLARSGRQRRAAVAVRCLGGLPAARTRRGIGLVAVRGRVGAVVLPGARGLCRAAERLPLVTRPTLILPRRCGGALGAARPFRVGGRLGARAELLG